MPPVPAPEWPEFRRSSQVDYLEESPTKRVWRCDDNVVDSVYVILILMLLCC